MKGKSDLSKGEKKTREAMQGKGRGREEKRTDKITRDSRQKRSFNVYIKK